MPNFELPDFSFEDKTWGAIANVATSDGNLILAERYADTGDVFLLVYLVIFFDMNGRPMTVRIFEDGPTRENRADAQEHFVARLSDSIWG